MSRLEIVLFLWLCGFSYKEIAEAMVIASATVNSHLRRAQVRYQCDSRAELKQHLAQTQIRFESKKP